MESLDYRFRGRLRSGAVTRAIAVVKSNAFGLAAALLTCALYFFIFANDRNAHGPGSDGAYSWIWARSIVFDGDIDFANDYRLCGDPLRQGIDRGTGRVDNPFYFGPALFWAPLLALLRVVIRVSPDVIAHSNACKGPLTMWTLALGPAAGALAIWLSYRAARRFAGDAPAALAAIAFGLGSSLYAYATVLPSYSHVYATLATSALLLVTLRAGERPASLFRWIVVGVWLGVAIVQRPTNIIFGLIPATVAYLSLRTQLRTLLVAWGAVGLGALPFVSLQLAVYQYLYGTAFATPQGPHYLNPWQAHPFLLLFAPYGGLFPTAPVAWCSVLGALVALRRRDLRWLAIALCGVGLLELWISSSALDWHGASTFGARRLTTLTPIFVIFAAIAFERARRVLERRPELARTALGVACLLPIAFATTGAVWSLPRSGVPLGEGPSQADLWGKGTTTAMSLVDERLGTMASLPAQWVFTWRYGLPGNRFRDATQAPWYIRDYRNLRFYSQTLPMADKRLGRTMTGFVRGDEDARMTGARSRIVFAAHWRNATEYRLKARAAKKGVQLRLGQGLAWGRVRWFGTVSLDDELREATIAIPEGAFGSGLNELVLEIVDMPPEDAGVQITTITIDDRREYPRIE